MKFCFWLCRLTDKLNQLNQLHPLAKCCFWLNKLHDWTFNISSTHLFLIHQLQRKEGLHKDFLKTTHYIAYGTGSAALLMALQMALWVPWAHLYPPPPPWVLLAHGLLWVRFCCCRCCHRCWRYKWNGIAVVIADCAVSVFLLLAFPPPLSGSSWPATISQKPHHMSLMLWTLGIHLRCNGNFKIRTEDTPSCDVISHVIYVPTQR